MRTLDLPTPRWALPLCQPARYKGGWGGRGSGKSHEFAKMVIEAHIADPDSSTVCVREVQKSLDQSVKRLLEHKIAALDVGDYFEIQKTAILSRYGEGRIIFVGMQDHTADSVKSLEGYDRAWVEEAQSLSVKSMRLLRPTIRKPGSELWFTWNPFAPEDAVDVLLRGPRRPPDAIVVGANYDDNPWFPEELRKEMEFDRVNSPETFEHVWKGGYFVGGEGRVYSRFDRRVNATPVVRGGRLVIGCDFNVRNMQWIIAEVDDVERKIHIVGEVIKEGGTTTDEHAERAAKAIMRRLGRTREDVHGMRIRAYPDASGQSLHTTSTLSDVHLLLQAGFRPDPPTRNPPIMERVNTVNVLFRDRRLSVDVDACPMLARALETQALDKNGEPEKKTGALDVSHILDALGYVCHRLFPVQRRAGVAAVPDAVMDEWGRVA